VAHLPQISIQDKNVICDLPITVFRSLSVRKLVRTFAKAKYYGHNVLINKILINGMPVKQV